MTLKDEIDELKGKFMAEEEFIEKMKKKADTNNDGVTTPVEWIMFLLKNPKFIIVGLMLIVLRELPTFLINGIEGGGWDWATLITTIIEGAILFVWYYFTNTTNQEYTTVLNKLKSEFDNSVKDKDKEIKDLKKDLADANDKNTALNAKIGLLEYQLDHRQPPTS